MAPGPRRHPANAFRFRSRYHPDWIRSAVSGGAHPLWLAEWLAEALDLRLHMRVLDLGQGARPRRFSCTANAASRSGRPISGTTLPTILSGIRDETWAPAPASFRCAPMPARRLFAEGFFDAVACIDCFPYFGTDDLYLSNLARFVKPAGVIGIAGAGLVREIDGPLPAHLREWWTPEHWALHSATLGGAAIGTARAFLPSSVPIDLAGRWRAVARLAPRRIPG